MALNIKNNDTVKVIAGKDNGKQGKVLQVFPEENMVVVDGANKVYRHIRPQKGGETGQRIEVNGPINLSNVQLVCSQCNKPTRVGFQEKEGKKERVCKKCKAVI
ncbi:50S ribosomal protein L24 [Patescibacteria group bacterium]